MAGDNDIRAVILAAGKGTRMKSKHPKVMHCLLGIPLLEHVTRTLEAAGIPRNHHVVVVGHGKAEVERYLSGTGVQVAYQQEQLGTGHAVSSAREHLQDFCGDLLIICGDTPLFKSDTLLAFINAHKRHACDISILSADFKDPTGYGRIIRDKGKELKGIIEEKDADEKIRSIREVNTGTYLVKGHKVFDILSKVGCGNAQGEYYLTDIVHLGLSDGLHVEAFKFADEEEALGVNSRMQLAAAEEILLDRIRRSHMSAGVTLSLPGTIYIEPDVIIGPDSFIGANTVLRGQTVIGEGAKIYPFSYLENYTCPAGARVGPFEHLVGCLEDDRVCA